MGAIAVFALMPGTGVVNINVGGYLKANGSDTIFLLVIAVLIFNDNVVQLAL